MVGLRAKAILQNSLLALISILIVSAFCELGLRFYTAHATAQTQLVIPFFDEPIADRHIEAIPVRNGMDRAWFRQEPPPVSRDLHDVSPAAVDLYEEYLRRGLYSPQSYYVWNKVFVNSHVCVKNDYVFGNYGDLASYLQVFTPSDGEPYPRYRFPPNTLTPGGLRTNRYGFRGPDLEPSKQPNTIRIAFLGASTTIASHAFPFSYPEYFGYWLNLWLQANHYPLRAEIINAGREGIGSTDIAAIFRDEVLPLNPDYVIYYEGANHISVGPNLIRHAAPLHQYPDQSFLPRQLVQNSALAKLVEDFYKFKFFPLLVKWQRSRAELVFPAGIDEFEPDIVRPDLPIDLPVILGNFRHIADLSEQSGVRFLVSSFIWLDGSEPGIDLHNPRHVEILSMVNRVFWPLSPRDIRRLVDFQNRVFQRFAAAYNPGFMDIARAFPRDPDLFTDGIHFTPEGVRMQGWIALVQFLPHLIRDLERGFTPKAQSAGTGSAMFVPTKGELFDPRCTPSPTELAAARTMPISAMQVAYEGSSLSPNAIGVVARSAPVPWIYIARLPLHTDCEVTDGQGWIGVDVRVIRGTIGIGVLNQAGDNFMVGKLLGPSKSFQTVFLRLASLNVGDLIIRNGGENESSESVVRKVQLIKSGTGMAAECHARRPGVKAIGDKT